MSLPELKAAPVTDDLVRIYLRGSDRDPLERIRETDMILELGCVQIYKSSARYCDGWGRWELYPGFHFYKRRFDFADTNQHGWAIIFKILPPTATPFHEWFVGWVPPERGAEAEGWISLLNSEIEKRLAEKTEHKETEHKKTEMTDEDHIRYMLDGGDRGLIEKLWETKDAWGFGGSLWLSKEHAGIKDGPMTSTAGEITLLNDDCRFERTRFHLTDTGATGFAVWFQRGPRDETSESLHNRSLCGWVPLEREAEVAKWIDFLNDLIATHVAKWKAWWAGLTDEQRQDAIGAAHLQRSLRWIESLGIPIPSMDEQR